MTTTVTRAIRSTSAWTANQTAMETLYGAGNYFTSLTSWWAWVQSTYPNLVSSDVIVVAECYNDWTGNGLSDGFVTISGVTSGVNNYPIVRAADGEGHGGIPGAGFRIYAFGTGTVLNFTQQYGRASDLEVNNTNDGNGYNFGFGFSTDSVAENIIARTSYRSFTINSSGYSAITNLRNCLALPAGPNRTPIGFIGPGSGYGSIQLDNCVAGAGCHNGFNGSSVSGYRQWILRNCVVADDTVDAAYVGSVTTGSTNNASFDGSTNTPPGASPYTSDVTSADFVNLASNDYHLASSSSLKTAGANLYSDFQYDVDGDEYPSSGSWPIGFDYLPAAGGTTHEASITFGSELYSTTGNNAILSASISYTNSLGYSDTVNALFEVYTTFSKSLTYLNNAGSIIDVAIIFAKELASTYQGNLILEAASTFIQSLGQNNSSDTNLNALIDLNIIEADQYNVNANFEEAIVFSNSLASIFTTGNIFNSEISFSTLQSVQSTVSAILEAATVYSNAQGISEGNIASLNAVQNFGITQSLLFSSIADLSSDISFNISEDFILNGELVTSGTIDAYTVLAINQGIGSQTGPNIYSPKLNVGIVQNIDSLTIANLFASSIFGSQLIFSTNAGNSIEAAISYGIIQQNIQSIDISIEGIVQFDIDQALNSNVQTEFDGAITLSHQAAIQNIAQAILNANLPLSCIQDIDVNGSLVSLTLQLPCGRTLRVQIESRSISVQPENRNTTISGCN